MKREYIAVPIEGTLVKLEEVPESTFASGTLGAGFAIKFTGKQLMSPISGTVIATFPTGHAFIVRREDGLELMIHVGINSAKKPEAFRAQVKKYQQVTQGQVLTLVDPKMFPEGVNYCPVVFSLPEIEVILAKEGQQVTPMQEDAVRIAY